VAAPSRQELSVAAPTTIIIDGGGTSTDVAVLRLSAIRARTTLASFKPTGVDDRTDDLCRALGAWLATVDADAIQPAYILIGMSGVWGDLEKHSYLNAFTDAWVTYVNHTVPRINILSDVELVLFAGLRERPGVVLIAGTGTIAVARDADGFIHRCGGWGPRIDDAGGGFWMGREALRAVARTLDGRGADTLLIRPVAAFLRTDPTDTVALAKALRTTSVDRASRLGVAVLTYADEGDTVAQEIRAQAAAELADCCSAVLRHVADDAEVVLYGSLFSNASFRELTISSIRVKNAAASVSILDDVITSTHHHFLAD
jgi:N-acetylglucosamine kinase-like BadF-type ATPase